MILACLLPQIRGRGGSTPRCFSQHFVFPLTDFFNLFFNCQLLLNTLAPLNYYTKLCQKAGNRSPVKLNSKTPTEISSNKISSAKSRHRAIFWQQTLQTRSAKRLNLPPKTRFLTKILALSSVLSKTSMLLFPFNFYVVRGSSLSYKTQIFLLNTKSKWLPTCIPNPEARGNAKPRHSWHTAAVPNFLSDRLQVSVETETKPKAQNN